jgi:hypothetical protein
LHFVDLAAFELAGTAHDGTFDIVGGHADGFGGGDCGAQARVGIRIASVARGDLYFFDEPCESFAALCVKRGLLVLNGCPFTMSGHYLKPLREPVPNFRE